MPIEETKKQLQQVGHAMIEQGLTWGNAGNISARVDRDSFVVSASGTRLGKLALDDLVRCPVRGEVKGVQPKLSKEVPMHQAVYQERPEIGAVLHGAPFYSTLVACTETALPADLFVENMYYLERVARVPYAYPGSSELGERVRAEARHANVLLLENHGVLVYDTSVAEALMALQVLELSCRMVVTARSAELRLQTLSAATVEDFLNTSSHKPKRDLS